MLNSLQLVVKSNQKINSTNLSIQENFNNAGDNLDEDEYVSLDVYNLSGVHITNLVDDVKISGTHFINWNGKNSKGVIVPVGQYFYKIFLLIQQS